MLIKDAATDLSELTNRLPSSLLSCDLAKFCNLQIHSSIDQSRFVALVALFQRLFAIAIVAFLTTSACVIAMQPFTVPSVGTVTVLLLPHPSLRPRFTICPVNSYFWSKRIHFSHLGKVLYALLEIKNFTLAMKS